MGMTRFGTLFAILFASTVSVGAQQGRSDGTFTWSKQLPAGSTFSIRNGDGFIHVGESTSDRVEVRAVKIGGQRTARDIAFDIDESRDGVTICTVYGQQTSCRDRNRSRRTTASRVDYTVLVPRDIRVDVGTGSGEVVVDRVGGGVNASTGRGRVFVATSRGPVNASSGSGDIDVRVQSTTDANIDVVTGSGLIRVSIPSDFNGEIDTQTGNGTLRSDFDITIVGRLDAQHIRGTIGRGGPRIRLQTGNGRIEIRKS